MHIYVYLYMHVHAWCTVHVHVHACTVHVCTCTVHVCNLLLHLSVHGFLFITEPPDNSFPAVPVAGKDPQMSVCPGDAWR